jgi:hypothetical protein
MTAGALSFVDRFGRPPFINGEQAVARREGTIREAYTGDPNAPASPSTLLVRFTI